MNDRRARLAGLDPDATLQVYPDILVRIHRAEHRAEMSAKSGGQRPSAPSGPLLAVLVSTGKRRGRVDVGGWRFDMDREQEQIASVVPPDVLASEAALALWVYPLAAAEKARVIQSDPDKIVFRAKGERLTDWQPVRQTDGIRSDGARGLRIGADDQGALVMDWWHVVDDDVFADIDSGVPVGEPALVTVLHTGGQAPTTTAQKGWFQADQTRFEPLSV